MNVPPRVLGRWRQLLVPATAVLGAFAVLMSLGFWQLERRAWKEALIATLDTRLALAQTPLPPPGEWGSLDPAEAEFRRVVLTAEFLPEEEAFVYTSGSSFRPDVKGVGYWVFSPARLREGGIVVVNRGFVPEQKRDPNTRPDPARSSPVELLGVLRWPEPRAKFAPADDPPRNLWFTRDHQAMAAAKGWGATAPFYVDLEAPVSAAGLPQPGRLQVRLRNDHLHYAITWFSLGAILLIVFGAWSRARLAGGNGPAEHDAPRG